MNFCKYSHFRMTNIIYNFHFYTPHNFTHQGATWSGNLQHYLTQRVPYPSKPADAAALQQQVPTELDKLWISRYAYDQWNAARIESEISIAAEWAKNEAWFSLAMSSVSTARMPTRTTGPHGCMMCARFLRSTASGGRCGITAAASAS